MAAELGEIEHAGKIRIATGADVGKPDDPGRIHEDGSADDSDDRSKFSVRSSWHHINEIELNLEIWTYPAAN